MSIFETIMLVCFGFAWPFSIYTSYKAKTAQGKNVFFLIVLLIGYFSGIIHKFFYSFDLVIILYIINFCLISIDTLLYIRNRQLDTLKKDNSCI
jgi:hypothetical protein